MIYMQVCWNWQTGTFEGRVHFMRMGSSPITCTNDVSVRTNRTELMQNQSEMVDFSFTKSRKFEKHLLYVKYML